MTREVRVVLVDADRAVLGKLPRFEVSPPSWSNAEPVVREARARFGSGSNPSAAMPIGRTN